MNQKFNLMVFAVLLFSLVSCGQTNKEEFLQGKWVVYKTTNGKGDSLTPKGGAYTNRPDTLEFLPNGKLNYYNSPVPDDPPQVSHYYFINDTIIRLGNRRFIFERIDNDKMMLQTYEPEMPQIEEFFMKEFWRRIDE